MVERSSVSPLFSLDMINFRSVLSSLPSSFAAVNMRRLRVVRLSFRTFQTWRAMSRELSVDEWSKSGLRHKTGYLWLWNNKQRYMSVCLLAAETNWLFGFTAWKSKTDKNSVCNSSPMGVKSSNVHWQKDAHHLKQPMKPFTRLYSGPAVS